MKPNLTIVKSNKVIEASYRLTLNEQRLVLACIAQVKRGQAISAADRFRVSAAEFTEVFGVPIERAYGELQQVAEKLYERSVTIQNPDPDYPEITHTKTRWVSSVDYLPGKGELILRFAPRMIPYLSLLEANFTPYRLEAVAGMSSIYGVRFYELLMQWNSRGTREVELSELKHMLSLEGQYPAIKDFKKYVIEPAMRDINGHSDLQASYTQRKSGRVVTHLIFEFQPKEVNPGKREKSVVKKITKAEIERHARPGETYAEAEARLHKQMEQGGAKPKP